MLPDSLLERLRKSIEFTDAYMTDNLRMYVEGILCRFRTGAPWRDLQPTFGPWKLICNKFYACTKHGLESFLKSCMESWKRV